MREMSAMREMSEMRKVRALREVRGMRTVRDVGVGDVGEGIGKMRTYHNFNLICYNFRDGVTYLLMSEMRMK
jgi:hypothetical protein